MAEQTLDGRVHSPGQAAGEAGLGLREDEKTESLRSAVGGDTWVRGQACLRERAFELRLQ